MMERTIRGDLELCRRRERSLLWKELAAIAAVVLVVVLRALWFA